MQRLSGLETIAIELQLHGVQYMGKLQTVALAVLIEGALAVEDWVDAPDAGAGVAQDEKIHIY